MKLNKLGALGLLVFGAQTSSLLAVGISCPIEVGTGSDSSFVIFDSPNIDLRAYEVFYNFDSTNPLGTDDLIDIINAEDSQIVIGLDNFGDPTNQILFDVAFNGVTEGEGFNLPEIWVQFVAGGQAGFPADSVAPISGSEFIGGSGISAPFRTVEPGSTDALLFGVFGEVSPSFSPVPEPSVWGLTLLGSLCLTARRRR